MTRTSKTIRVRLFVAKVCFVQSLFIALQVIKVSGNRILAIEKYNFIDQNESRLHLSLENCQKMSRGRILVFYLEYK